MSSDSTGRIDDPASESPEQPDPAPSELCLESGPLRTQDHEGATHTHGKTFTAVKVQPDCPACSRQRASTQSTTHQSLHFIFPVQRATQVAPCTFTHPHQLLNSAKYLTYFIYL